MTPADLRSALNIPSFFTMPDLEHLSPQDSVASQLAKAALILYKNPAEASSLEGRRIDWKRMKERFLTALAEKPVPELSPLDKFILFCVQAERGEITEKVLEKAYKSLDAEETLFLEEIERSTPGASDGQGYVRWGRPAVLLKIQNSEGAIPLEELLEYKHEKEQLARALSELKQLEKLLRERPAGWDRAAKAHPRWQLVVDYARPSSQDPSDPKVIEKLVLEVAALKPIPSKGEHKYIREQKSVVPSCKAAHELLASVRRAQVDELVRARVPLPQILERLSLTTPEERLYAITNWINLEDLSFEEKQKGLVAIAPLLDDITSSEVQDKLIPNMKGLTPAQELELTLAVLKGTLREPQEPFGINVRSIASQVFLRILCNWSVSNEERFDALATVLFLEAHQSAPLEGSFRKLFGIEGISREQKIKAMALIISAPFPASYDDSIRALFKFAFLSMGKLTAEEKFEIQAPLLILAAGNLEISILYLRNFIRDIPPTIAPRKKFDTCVAMAKRRISAGGIWDALDLFRPVKNITEISDPEKLSALIPLAKLAVAQEGNTITRYLDDLESYLREAEKERQDRITIAKFALMHNPQDAAYLKDPRTASEEELHHLHHIQLLSQDEPLPPDSAPWIHALTTLDIRELAPVGSLVRRKLEEEARLSLEPNSPAWKRMLLHRAMALYLRGHEADSLLSQIMEYRNPQKAAYMTYLLSNIAPSLALYEELAKEMTLTGLRAPLRYPLLFVADIAREAKLERATDQLKRIAQAIDASFKTLKDATKLGVFLNLLQSLHKNLGLTPEEKLSLLERLFAEKRGKEWFNKVSTLSALFAAGLFNRGWPEGLAREFTLEDLTHMLTAALNLPELDLEEYATFSTSQKRLPFGLETYLARLSSLKDSALTPCIQKFFSSLLNGTFKEARYEATGNPHLEKLQKAPVLWEKWVNLARCDFSPATNRAREVGRRAGSGGSSSLAYMKQKLITDNHLPQLRTSYPHLYDHLNPTTSSLPSQAITRFEELCLDILGAKTKDEEKERLITLNEFIQHNATLKQSEWANDVQARIREFSLTEAAKESALVVTDEWEDLFLSGTEVLGSCQRLDGSEGLNKCLLSYCMDGKIQMIAAIDPKTHRLQARALLKLLFVEESPGVLAPALFLERVYPFDPPLELVYGINQMAKEAAIHLGIPLYSNNPSLEPESETGREEARLQSLGSNAPYEYSDAGGGVTSGIFSHLGKRVPLTGPRINSGL